MVPVSFSTIRSHVLYGPTNPGELKRRLFLAVLSVTGKAIDIPMAGTEEVELPGIVKRETEPPFRNG